MRIRLYQINLNRDKDHLAFIGLEHMQNARDTNEIDSTIYDEVFDGDTMDGGLDDIFRTFTLNHPKGYKGRSLSVSDVIEVFLNNGKSAFWYCDVIGFAAVSFHPEQAKPLPQWRPEWGIYPEGVTTRLYWGARAIITSGKVELLSDRQSFHKREDVTEAEQRDFMDWINHKALPIVNAHVRGNDTAHIKLRSIYAPYFLIAEDRESEGYLYIGAYEPERTEDTTNIVPAEGGERRGKADPKKMRRYRVGTPRRPLRRHHAWRRVGKR